VTERQPPDHGANPGRGTPAGATKLGHEHGPVGVRVVLPGHCRDLTGIEGEVRVVPEGEPTPAAVLDALEARYPTLRGTIRDHSSGVRRAYLRYFACGRDISHEPEDTPLPDEVVDGREVFRVLGAISGG